MKFHKHLQLLHGSFLKRKSFLQRANNCVISARNKTNICVVGSGPAGFYTAELLLKESDVHVDLVEKLPIPFGLIRYGVAPDHPEIKKAINKFVTTATSGRCNFYGNINVGNDVSLKELLQSYNAVVLAYGAAEDRALGIPGENSKNVFSARQVVGWYNGIPENTNEPVNLDTEVAAIVGHGNVAIDVARILLRNTEELEKTDITEHSLQKLRKSRIRKVILIGRRGPLQVAFTVKELREMTKLQSCQTVMHPQDFVGVRELLPTIQRPRHRLTELLVSTLDESPRAEASKQVEIKYYRSPKAIQCNSNGNIEKMVLSINKCEGSIDSGKVISTDEEEIINCGLVIRSVGYKSVAIDPLIPFDEAAGVVKNTNGRVNVHEALYCSGWLKTGPIGVIPSTMRTSYETGARILKDLKDGKLSAEDRGGAGELLPLLKNRGIDVITFDHWLKLDAEEQRRGSVIGKPREKIVDIDEMRKIIGL